MVETARTEDSFRLPTAAAAPLDSAGAVERAGGGATPHQHDGRPALDASAGDVLGLAQGMIRVLDDEHRVAGAWADPPRPADDLIAGLRDMLLVRTFDARMLRAHRQGKISFYMQSLGEEAIACAHRRALREGDMNFPTYRQQGLLIAAGYPIVDLMHQVRSNASDPMKGRQLPVFYSSKSHGFFSISGNLATQFVQGVGWAMAAAMSDDDRIASAWIGEGASAESDFHAALVFASTYQAPVILNVVNNQWAISTPEHFARGAAHTFAERGLGYGIPSLRVDGNDFLAVWAASEWAASRARGGHGPTLIEWVTYRAGAHSTADDPSAYRPKDDSQQWPLGDPVERLSSHLIELGAWSEGQQQSLQQQVDEIVANAATEAEAQDGLHDGNGPSAATMFDDVYAVLPWHLREQRQQCGF